MQLYIFRLITIFPVYQASTRHGPLIHPLFHSQAAQAEPTARAVERSTPKPAAFSFPKPKQKQQLCTGTRLAATRTITVPGYQRYAAVRPFVRKYISTSSWSIGCGNAGNFPFFFLAVIGF